MTDRELIKHLATEYFSQYTNNLNKAPSFYDYLLRRGFKKAQLSALGISRNIQAGDAQSWRGEDLD